MGLPLAIAFAGLAHAQPAAAPQGTPVAGRAPRDSEFGVGTRQFGLQRRVEMYQWRRDGGRYARVWSEHPIDSAGADAAHANPGAFPVQTRYWIATGVTLDGKRVDDDVLRTLGRWRDFRPGFSALPGNLSATFQPEGDGLASAENPLDPQVGDLRITWRELTLPPLAGRVALEDGVWVPSVAASATASAGTAAQAGDIATDAKRSSRHAWWFGGLGVFALVALGLALRRRALRRRS